MRFKLIILDTLQSTCYIYIENSNFINNTASGTTLFTFETDQYELSQFEGVLKPKDYTG